eukprot:PLAT7423.1.p1 GENE.PLAT7423.1~~PLAT7423.1.p1  ORF type:complete len:429 (+),score=220.08 PLAT7423.1:76-1362(+)
MSLLNINGSDDPSYRYKMPRLESVVQGRGNGIKTVVKNASAIAEALHRGAGTITKFFGVELGALSKWDASRERSVVNGAHETRELQRLLFRFIELFVLCPSCRYPETSFKISKGIIYHRCAACGAKSPVDMDHKLCTYILKQAAMLKKARKGKKAGKGDKAARRARRAERAKGGEGGGSSAATAAAASAADDDIEWHSDLSPEAVARRRAAMELGKSVADMEAEAAAAAEAGAGAAEGEVVATSDSVAVDEEEAISSAVAAFQAFVAAGNDAAAQAEELERLQTNAAMPSHYRVVIYFRASFSVAMREEIAAQLPVMEEVLFEGDSPAFISCIEWLVGKQHPELMPATPLILKMLYDESVLEEEALLSWADGERRSETTAADVSDETLAAIQEACAPFITWLKEAEEDEEDDEEEEDEDEDEDEEEED